MAVNALVVRVCLFVPDNSQKDQRRLKAVTIEASRCLLMGHTILLIENNSDDALLVELAFERAKIPHRLVVVTDATEGLNYIKGSGRYGDRERFPFPKLVLLDLGLPGISGFELLEQMRADSVAAHLPVTVLSGSDYLRDVTRAYALGANSFLVKPSHLQKFTDAIKETVQFWLGDGARASSLLYLKTPAHPTFGSGKFR